jgi:hypothetical protein
MNQQTTAGRPSTCSVGLHLAACLPLQKAPSEIDGVFFFALSAPIAGGNGKLRVQ